MCVNESLLHQTAFILCLLLCIVQLECDRQVEKIVQQFQDERGLDNKV